MCFVDTMTKNKNENVVSLIAVDDLHFDPLNPRLPTAIHNQNEQEVLTWMIDKATVTELIGSIAANGYFPGEPLMVVKRPEGGYFVIEGNRRLAAAKLLLNPHLATLRKNEIAQASEGAKERPKELPAMIFENRAKILDNLGFRHVTGIKPWPTLAKARYLKQLRASFPSNLPEKDQARIMAKSIGSRPDYVAGLMTGLQVYEAIEARDYFNINGIDEQTLDFSLLTTAMGYKNISTFLGMESGRSMDTSGLIVNRLEELTRWIFERNSEGKTRVGESRRLSDLAKVIGTPQAVDAFRSGRPLVEALLLTGAPTENFKQAISDAIARVKDAQDNLSHKLELSSTDLNDLQTLFMLTKTVRDAVRLRLSEDEDDE